MQNNLLSKRFEILAKDKELLKKIFHLATICNENNKVIIKNYGDFIQIKKDTEFLDSPVWIYIFKDLTIKSWFLGEEMNVLNEKEIKELFNGIK